MLARQRRFVADASHELRTPLTSVLANLELLADALDGEQGEAARSALRSSRRMRRLVADLLLLARTDVGRVVTREPCDLAQIVVEAAGELGPVAGEHEIVARRPAGGRRRRARRAAPAGDQPDRERAAPHARRARAIRVDAPARGDGQATLVVEDDGPGMPGELAPTLFERFVRGARRSRRLVRPRAWRSSGPSPSPTAAPSRCRRPRRHGARFVVRMPDAPDAATSSRAQRCRSCRAAAAPASALRPRRRPAAPSGGA